MTNICVFKSSFRSCLTLFFASSNYFLQQKSQKCGTVIIAFFIFMKDSIILCFMYHYYPNWLRMYAFKSLYHKLEDANYKAAISVKMSPCNPELTVIITLESFYFKRWGLSLFRLESWVIWTVACGGFLFHLKFSESVSHFADSFLSQTRGHLVFLFQCHCFWSETSIDFSRLL